MIRDLAAAPAANRWLRLAIVGAIALAALAVSGARLSARAESSSTVLVAQNSQLSQSILTDANGMTLYIFINDTAGAGVSTCAGGCATVWPAFHVPTEELTLPAGAMGVLGSITGTDGAPQVTYNGMPLYYYAGDANPGDVKGQGIGGIWFAAQP